MTVSKWRGSLLGLGATQTRSPPARSVRSPPLLGLSWPGRQAWLHLCLVSVSPHTHTPKRAAGGAEASGASPSIRGAGAQRGRGAPGLGGTGAGCAPGSLRAPRSGTANFAKLMTTMCASWGGVGVTLPFLRHD